MRIDHLMKRSARLFPDVVAVHDGRARRTFAELALRASHLAAGLKTTGLGVGDRVAIVARNRVEYVELYFALAELGAVAVPINWRLRSHEMAYIISDSRARAIFAEEEFHAPLEAELDTCPSLERFVSLDGARGDWDDYEACIGPEAHSPTPPDHDLDGIAVQMYTSGTTGLPKGAMLSHRNVYALLGSWLLDMPLEPRVSRFLQVTPLFHVGAFLMVMSTVASGASLRLMEEFLPGPALEILVHERITHALFVPAMVQWLLAEPGVEQLVFPELRLVVYGAAPMPVPLLERAMERFHCGFLQGYGLTETVGVLTTLRPEDHILPSGGELSSRLASAGRPVLCCEMRVVDSAGAEVAPGEVGEIVARGTHISPGYFEQPEATAEAMRGGWFHTGDLGTVDEEGYFTIVDRLKDMILVAGENVYSSEVELLLREHEAVADAAVIGIPHELWGEEVLALVALESQAQVSERELIQHCRAKLARFKCPTRVELRDEIPRNPAGKIPKHELRAPYWEGRERKV
jgi:acyl-CoA synthetase (AMP-forming)/AMP-acid ligase II